MGGNIGKDPVEVRDQWIITDVQMVLFDYGPFLSEMLVTRKGVDPSPRAY